MKQSINVAKLSPNQRVLYVLAKERGRRRRMAQLNREALNGPQKEGPPHSPRNLQPNEREGEMNISNQSLGSVE